MRLACFSLLLICTPLAALEPDRYTARFDAGLKSVEVRACFSGAVPNRLYRHRHARDHSTGPLYEGVRLEGHDDGDALGLPSLPDGACIDWRVDLESATSGSDYGTAFRLSGDVLVSTDLWFWTAGWRRPAEVRVDLPNGLHFSAPWPGIDTPGGRVYRPAQTPTRWPSRTTIGHLPTRSIPAQGADIELALIGDISPPDADKLTAWIRRPVESVTGVFGHFPQHSLQVVVVGIGPRGDPVPWAHVMRGGGPAVELFVDHTRPLSELDADWTATHEFSHLLLPYVSSHDRWLSEGLASYYQNVLRARDGRLSDTEAWRKLDGGFRRGKLGTSRGTLAEATRGERDQTMRVYWSGAAMLLTADARLRQQSAGKQSLDTVLKALHDCCSTSGRAWKAWDLFREMDRLSGSTIFTGVYREHVNSQVFPDLSDIYRELGLRSRFGRLDTVDDAPLQDVREQIMQAAQG